MPHRSPLWPARLDHIRLDAADPASIARFYAATLGMTALAQADGTTLLHGPERRIVIGGGTPGTQPYSAFRLGGPAQLAELRSHLAAKGLALLPSPTPVFGEGAVAVRDPDGRLAVFGLPRADLDPPPSASPAAALSARLQHVVVASTRLAEMMNFYEDALGFVPSDYVRESTGNHEPTVAFYRSDPEHHSFAVFRAPEARPDHHAYETRSWNDIRDWADFVASRGIKLWWGPGRHGPGNNLFFMIKDPQGYLIELSAELEIVPDAVAKRSWPHEERTLNLWGPGFMRS
ncbi:MAG: VOC family protein [Alphaproteobacteria bacterium]|nr:VOC family protein [Alphaproteobacteria bacterium]